MRFAQTIVDEPKYGARRREAVISVASAPIPAPKTSAPSAKLPGRSPAAVSRHCYRPKTRSISPSVRAASTPVTDDDEREHEPEPHARPPLLAVPLLLCGSARTVVPVAREIASGSSGGSSSRAREAASSGLVVPRANSRNEDRVA